MTATIYKPERPTLRSMLFTIEGKHASNFFCSGDVHGGTANVYPDVTLIAASTFVVWADFDGDLNNKQMRKILAHMLHPCITAFGIIYAIARKRAMGRRWVSLTRNERSLMYGMAGLDCDSDLTPEGKPVKGFIEDERERIVSMFERIVDHERAEPEDKYNAAAPSGDTTSKMAEAFEDLLQGQLLAWLDSVRANVRAHANVEHGLATGIVAKVEGDSWLGRCAHVLHAFSCGQMGYNTSTSGFYVPIGMKALIRMLWNVGRSGQGNCAWVVEDTPLSMPDPDVPERDWPHHKRRIAAHNATVEIIDKMGALATLAGKVPCSDKHGSSIITTGEAEERKHKAKKARPQDDDPSGPPRDEAPPSGGDVFPPSAWPPSPPSGPPSDPSRN